MQLNLVIDGRSWVALIAIEFFLLIFFVIAFVVQRPLPLSDLHSATILIQEHAEHGPIDLGVDLSTRGSRERVSWPAGIWIRPRTGDTMFDAQGPVAEAMRPWLATKDVVHIRFPPGSCRPPSVKTSGGDSRFERVCVILQATVGDEMVWRYRPESGSRSWGPFFILVSWSALIVYFYRREGRRR